MSDIQQGVTEGGNDINNSGDQYYALLFDKISKQREKYQKKISGLF